MNTFLREKKKGGGGGGREKNEGELTSSFIQALLHPESCFQGFCYQGHWFCKSGCHFPISLKEPIKTSLKDNILLLYNALFFHKYYWLLRKYRVLSGLSCLRCSSMFQVLSWHWSKRKEMNSANLFSLPAGILKLSYTELCIPSWVVITCSIFFIFMAYI